MYNNIILYIMVPYEYYYYYYTTVVCAVYDRVCAAVKITTSRKSHTHRHRHHDVDYSVLCTPYLYKITSTSITKYRVVLFSKVLSWHWVAKNIWYAYKNEITRIWNNIIHDRLFQPLKIENIISFYRDSSFNK